MEEETQIPNILHSSEFVDTPLNEEKPPILESMEIENPPTYSRTSDQILDGFEKILEKEENPISDFPKSDKIQENEKNPISDFPKSDEIVDGSEKIQGEEENPCFDPLEFDKPLNGSSRIDEGECSKTVAELTIEEGGEKLEKDDFDGLAESDWEEGKIVGESAKGRGKFFEDGKNQGGKIVGESSKEGWEEECTELNNDLGGFNGNEEDGLSLGDMIHFGDNDDDNDIEKSRLFNPHYGPWPGSGPPYRCRCRCGNCLETAEAELYRKNHGMGWSNSRAVYNVEHCYIRDAEFLYERRMGRLHRYQYPTLRCCKMRAHSFARENEYRRRGFRDPWLEPEPCPVGAGLENLGNTCFMNAILQCFTHNVSLVQGLLSLKHEASSHGVGEFCVLCAVRDQVEHSLGHSGLVISPSHLVDNLSHISSFFRRYQQEDAHEFLQCLLDRLDTNWSKYEESANDSFLPSDTLVRQIFGGRLVSQIRCCKCGHNSDTYEPLIDLSLEIEDVDSLESALNSFTKVESIEDTEKFTCNGCKEQVKVEKQLLIDQTPSVAALHLKRFKSDGVIVEKIDKKVEFPLELNLSPYTKCSNNENDDLKYELFGVVVHVGLSSTSGHYFCYVRTDPDKWYRFDDSKVAQVSEKTVLCQDAYILFYARKGTPWFDSLIEKWKAECFKKISSTSPKSVLGDMNPPSTSYPVGTGLHACEVTRKGDAVEDTSIAPSSELRQDEVKTIAGVGTGLHGFEANGKRDATADTVIMPGTKLMQDEVQTNVVDAQDTATELMQVGVETIAVDTQDSAVVTQTCASSLSVPINVDCKEDKIALDIPLLMEENDACEDKTSFKKIDEIELSSGGTRKPSHAEGMSGDEPKNDVEIRPSTPIKALSPDIYSDDAEETYHIPVDHIKIVNSKSSSAKKSINTDVQNRKRKEAVKCIKSMPSGRRQMFLSAISPRSDSLLSKKRKRHVSVFDNKHTPNKGRISPKRVLRPVQV